MAWFGIPIIDKILGIGEKAADRLIPDKNKAQDQAHEERQTQAQITNAGQSAAWYTPRNLLLYALIVPVALQFGIKPVIDWVLTISGSAQRLPDIPNLVDAIKLLVGLLGLS